MLTECGASMARESLPLDSQYGGACNMGEMLPSRSAYGLPRNTHLAAVGNRMIVWVILWYESAGCCYNKPGDKRNFGCLSMRS